MFHVKHRKEKIMELKDTARLMLSDDYKDRFKAEYYQLKIRCDKLGAMLENWNNLDFTPDTPYKTLWEQYACMNQYKEKLLKRAYIEHIEL